MGVKTKVISVLILLLAIGYGVAFHLPISSGKRVGNLVKLSKKGRFFFLKTWEGTLDEGSGDKLTSYFSISSEKIARELYEYEGKQVILFYEQYLVGFPRDTKYDIVAWRPKLDEAKVGEANSALLNYAGTAHFCSLLGTLYKASDLYQRVKTYLRENNIYLYNQIEKCNQ